MSQYQTLKRAIVILCTTITILGLASCSNTKTSTKVINTYKTEELRINSTEELVGTNYYNLANKIVESISNGDIDDSITYSGYIEFMTPEIGETKIYIIEAAEYYYGDLDNAPEVTYTDAPNTSYIQTDESGEAYIDWLDIPEADKEARTVNLVYNNKAFNLNIEMYTPTTIDNSYDMKSDYEYLIGYKGDSSIQLAYFSLYDNRSIYIIEYINSAGEIDNIDIKVNNLRG